MNKIKNLLLTGIALILMQACGSSTKEADLPVRKSCNLERLYKDMPQNIRTDTPDLAFVNALCAGKADEVAALFREKNCSGTNALLSMNHTDGLKALMAYVHLPRGS